MTTRRKILERHRAQKGRTLVYLPAVLAQVTRLKHGNKGERREAVSEKHSRSATESSHAQRQEQETTRYTAQLPTRTHALLQLRNGDLSKSLQKHHHTWGRKHCTPRLEDCVRTGQDGCSLVPKIIPTVTFQWNQSFKLVNQFRSRVARRRLLFIIIWNLRNKWEV